MPRLNSVFLTFIFVVLLTIVSSATDQRALSITKIDSAEIASIKELRVNPEPFGKTARVITPAGKIVWRVDGWVTGNELYKTYLDPSLACDNPYPFTITEVKMSIYFARPTVLMVSVDIEDVLYPSAECPWPDSALAISTDYQVSVAEPGLYDIWIPLDEPLVVSRPFFAGFFVGNAIDTADGVAVVTNDNPSASCQTYNIWDENLGFMDLVNNGVWNFPGQLMLSAAGYPGGREQVVQPAPSVKILSPCDREPLFEQTTIWAYEISGSSIIEYVDFEYLSSDEYIRIGRDYEGNRPSRDGLTSCANGDGYSHMWDFSSLSEGYYTIRVTAYDTLGRSASDEITIYVEPTPPTPRIIAPSSNSDVCAAFDLLMRCSDDNLARVSIFHKEANSDYSAGIEPLQLSGHKEYYCAPVAAATAIMLWDRRGYTSLLDTRDHNHRVDSLVEELAARFCTRENGGTTDEAFYSGLLQYSFDHDSLLTICNYTRPDYAAIRVRLEEEENAVLLALGGQRGMWLAVDGFQGWNRGDDTYLVTVANPFTGKVEAVPLRDKSDGAQIRFDGNWQTIERMVTVLAADWKVKRGHLGDDTDEADGWSLSVAPNALAPDRRHFIRAEGIDDDGLTHYHTVILNHDCSHSYIKGDYDGDGEANIVDLACLIDLVAGNGSEPSGGSARADANGDNQINITDIVYYLNYLYGMASPPRR